MSTTPAPTLDGAALLGALQSRYAVQSFDVSRKIDASTWDVLEQALVLTPSSFGIQPWKFVIVTDEALKAALLPHGFGQPKITQCSHLVVFCAKTELSDEDASKLVAANASIRHLPQESLNGFQTMLNATISARSKEDILIWNQRQCYIALGLFIEASALLGVDTAPMEGFLPDKFNEVLNLEGYTATVLAAAGYRAPDDKYGDMPKVRYSREDIVDRR